MYKDKTIRQLYNKGVSVRERFIDIARDNSEVTVPYLYPDLDISKGQEFDRPFQSLGARGINHLSSQLLNILFPTDRPYFRLTFTGSEAQELDPDTLGQVEDKLIEIEKIIQTDFDSRALRSSIFSALKLLLVGGTVVISNLDNNFRVINLNKFVVDRKANKSPNYVCIKDEISQSKCLEIAPSIVSKQKKATYTMYTGQFWNEDGSVYIKQEIEGEELNRVDFKKPQILVVTSNLLDNEDYGRSYVEELQGDLFTFEKLSEAIVQSASLAAKSIYLVDPAGLTRGRDLARANHGDVIAGRPNDVHVLQSEKGADLQIVFTQAQELKDRLGKAFLLASESFPQRQLTATEARARISEIEAGLGGIYSTLSQTLQMPFIELLVENLEEKGQIPELPKGVNINIVTGLDLMNRRTELQNISEFIQFVGMFGEQAFQLIDVVSIMAMVARAIGLDPNTVMSDPAEMQNPQEASQMALKEAMSQAMGGASIGAGQAAQAGTEEIMSEQIQASMRGA